MFLFNGHFDDWEIILVCIHWWVLHSYHKDSIVEEQYSCYKMGSVAANIVSHYTEWFVARELSLQSVLERHSQSCVIVNPLTYNKTLFAQEKEVWMACVFDVGVAYVAFG